MQFKTLLFLSILTGLILAAGYAIGGQQGVLYALVFSAALNFVSYWFSDKFVLAMYGAKPISREDDPKLYSIVAEVAEKMKIPVPRLYMVNLPVPNAFATGRNPQHAAVAVSPSIMQLLDEREMKGVLAHELSHVSNRDILISSIAATLAGALSYIANIAYYGMMFGGSGDRNRRGNPIGGILLIVITPVIATLLNLAISRSREYLADETGAKTLGDPDGLASALAKLGNVAKAHPLLGRPSNEATAHMFIVNPFKPSILLQLFSTHPPIEERIRRLQSLRS